MEAEDVVWSRALSHRAGDELRITHDRLVGVGITAQDVLDVLEDLGDSLLAQGPSGPLRSALLWNEVSAYLAFAQERAAFNRRAAYAQLLEHMSLVKLASLLGVSRQAVHKSVNSRSARAPFPVQLRPSGNEAQRDH